VKVKEGDLVENKNAKDNNLYVVLEVNFYGEVAKLKTVNTFSLPLYMDTKNLRKIE